MRCPIQTRESKRARARERARERERERERGVYQKERESERAHEREKSPHKIDWPLCTACPANWGANLEVEVPTLFCVHTQRVRRRKEGGLQSGHA
jgi:hypothetical protein